jgi:molecular chaperone GrpE
LNMENERDQEEFEVEMDADLAGEPDSTPGAESDETGEVEVEQPVSPEDMENLKNELNEMRTKADEYLDGWQRARADFANYKKRVDRDQAQVYQLAVSSIVKRYLDVVDDLERALKNKPQQGDGAVWAEGIELVYRKMLALLESEGVKQMDAQGEIFDPNLHEAISQEAHPEYEDGQIIEVIKQGYLLGDRVIRPALVRVAA